jgi:magnesium chelatase family protein
MSFSRIRSRASVGLAAPPVQIETHLASGLPAFSIVGLPETAVRESRDRVRSALLSSEFEFPDRRITVNLAPADLPKGGGRFDLPIALGILVASGQLPSERLENHEFIGELALNGRLRPVRGSLPFAMAAAAAGRQPVVPSAVAPAAAWAEGASVLPAGDLLSLCAYLRGRVELTPARPPEVRPTGGGTDLEAVRGQPLARRALEIAAAGGHHLLLSGPPGAGKTLLASCLPGLLPPASGQERLEQLALQSLASDRSLLSVQRPFRAPHHSASAAALVGGGAQPVPGEISLAHGGVLFLDELPEFPRATLDMLREPLESGRIRLARVRGRIEYPARFQLVAAMNPCPCGYHGDPDHGCRCSPDVVRRYQQRVSGPLLDRIDLRLNVARQPASLLLGTTAREESSAVVRERVGAAHKLQVTRQGGSNAALSGKALLEACNLPDSTLDWLGRAADRLRLSGRALERTLRVARTVADLERAPAVSQQHLAEALALRHDPDRAT